MLFQSFMAATNLLYNFSPGLEEATKFLTSRSVSKHVLLFALGVDPTAKDAGEGGVPTLFHKLHPLQCCAD